MSANPLRTELAVALALAESSTLDEAMPRVLEAICRASAWDCGGLWEVDRKAGVLRWVAGWHNPGLEPFGFEGVSGDAVLPRGVGLPGRVWTSGEAAWVADVAAESNFPRHDAAVRAGLHAAVCFPIVTAGEVSAVMEFFSREVRPPDEQLLVLMQVIGVQIGEFVRRRRAEEAWRRSESRNAAVVAAALDCIVAMDHEGKVIEWNAAAERTFGYTRGEAIGRELAELIIPPAYRERHRQGLARYLVTGEGALIGRRLEITAVRKGGEEFPVELTIIRLPSEDPPAFTGFLRDITDRIRAEEALRESAARLKFSLEAAGVGDWDLDLTNDTSRRSPLHDRAFGYDSPVENWGFQTFIQHVHPEDRADIERAFHDALEQRKGWHFECRVVWPDGSVHWIEVHGSIYRTAEGKPVRMIGMIRETTPRKLAEAERESLLESERQARAEAERMNRMKDEFLATLSHELRTPLNAIYGWSQMLLRSDTMPAATVRQGLETIERNARAQTQIIEDLLDMSRIISGRIRLDVRSVALVPVIEAAVETVRHAAESKGVRLQTVLDPDAGPVRGDPNRLQQVFWNLLSNAIKFTPRGGRVQVVLERVNSHVEARVTDTGEGIAPEFLPHVFDRFRQADPSTTRQHGGLGLGLAIVKQLVELHGGTIRARSAGAGSGSSFTVALPTTAVHPIPDAEPEPPAAERDAAPAAPPGCADIAGVKVLVVDDEPDARELLRRLLEGCGALVRTAASANEAIDHVRRDRPDVLVSDIGMPGEDGYALLKRVRALGPGEGGGVPAVAVTAYARPEDRVRAMRAGFQMHIAKPVEPAELVATVASLAGRT